MRGRWELLEQIGEGSWARVYAARMSGTTGSDYALKMPKPQPLQSGTNSRHAQSLAMLQREALVSSSVAQPHLAPVLDWQLRGEPFIVMPRLAGWTVRKLLEHRRCEYGCLIGGAKFLPHSVWMARQIASALAALHGSRWLHGDVKPENVLVSPQGHVTLIDLGLARKLGSRECQGGDVLAGTLAYVSPETFLPAMALGGESDIYSLGVLLHELLTGQPLFEEADPTRLALRHLREVPTDVREAALDVPPALARLVMRMLAKDPLRRPPAVEVVRQLTRLEIELMASE
ncbi:MAG: serine/threonine protein kinase [Pirellulaceae bacterium]|nr:serine/threonine protein kinase [Pirellulaceae bacterium]